MKPIEREILKATLASLAGHPEEWTRDWYAAHHRSGAVHVWIANDYYAVSIKASEAVGPALVGREQSLWGRLITWRRKLYQAAMAIPSTADKARAAGAVAALDALREAPPLHKNERE